MKVFIGADHRGFSLKQSLKQWLSENNVQHEDVGAHELDPNDDYPQYAQKVAEQVGQGGWGIVICGSGVGVDIVANKFDGVRCGLAVNKEQIEAARKDDDINVLAIAADTTSEADAKEMVSAFIDTAYEASEKHARRLEEIKEIEDMLK